MRLLFLPPFALVIGFLVGSGIHLEVALLPVFAIIVIVQVVIYAWGMSEHATAAPRDERSATRASAP